MKFSRTQILIFAVVIGVVYAVYRREMYEKEKENVKDAAKAKDMSQEELDAVLKFIKK